MGKHKLYLDYRASSVEGVPEIPVHWQAKRVRFVLKPGYDGLKIGPFGSQLRSEMLTRSGYKVYGQENVIGHDFTLGERYIDQEKFDELSVYKIYPGDILITMMGSSGNCQIAPKDIKLGIMDSHLIRLRVRDVEVDNRFFRLLIDTAPYVKHQIKLLGKGSIMHGLNSSIIKELTLVLPARQEQAKILDFLDYETTKIEQLIARQKRLIELLKEKRQAVISHAVTKGLNPDAPMKDSSVEWLGEVPAHWDVARLKHVTTLQSGVAKGRDLSEKDTIKVPYLRVANVQDGYLDLDDVAEMEIQKTELTRYLLRNGDVLMNEGGDNDKLGRGAVWKSEVDPCIHQNHVFAIRPLRVEPEWLTMVTQSSYAKYYFFLVAKQSTNLASISSTNIKETPLVIPPADERITILSFMDTELKTYDRIMGLANKQIALLREHRTALISAAVTGKIDVRSWQRPNSKPQTAATAASA